MSGESDDTFWAERDVCVENYYHVTREKKTIAMRTLSPAGASCSGAVRVADG